MNKVMENIIQSYSKAPMAWELSPSGRQDWILGFFNQLQFSDLSLEESLKLLRQFYASDLSEKSFWEIFDDKVVERMTFVPLSQQKQQLTRGEIQKIAFNLSNKFNIKYESSYFMLKRLYLNYPQSEWNAETFIRILGTYDPELKAHFFISELKIA